MANMSLSMRIGAVVDGSLDRALGGVTRDLQRLDTTTARLTARQQRLGGMLGGSLDAGNADLVQMRRNYTRITRQIENTQRAQERLNRSIERGQRIGELQSRAGSNFASSSAQVAAFAVPVGAVVNEAMKFESAMAEVNKTVDFSAGNSIGKLGEELKELSLQIPLSANELASISASGGQLGVADTELVTFTETVAKMGVAFDMSADKAGDAMAKLSNVMKIPVTEIDRVGDMINVISNNSPAKAREIVTAMSRAGDKMKGANFSEEFSVGLTGALIAQGRDASTASSAIESMLTTFSTLDMATKRQVEGFNALGVNIDDFAIKFKQDGQGAVEAFLKATEKLPKADRLGTLASILGREYGGDILTVANNTELLAKNVDLLGKNADGTAKYVGSMNKEFESMSSTNANKLNLFKNNLNVLAITLGDALLPALNETITAVTPMVQKFGAWAKQNPELIASIVKIVGGLLLAKAAFWGVSFAVLSVAKPIAGMVTNFNALRASIMHMRGLALLGQLTSRALMFSRVIGFIGSAFTPLILTFGLLASTALLIYTYWKPIKAFFAGMFSGIADGLAPLKGLFDEVLAPLKPILDILIGTFSNFGTQVEVSSEKMLKIQAAGAAIGYAIGTVVRVVATGFKVVGTVIGTTIGFIVVQGSKLIQWFSGMWTQLKAFANSGVGNILRTIASFTPLGLFVRAFSAVFSYFGGLGAKFRSYGINIIQGLINGVTAKFGALKAKMSAMASQVAGAFKGVLGIHSPSRVFMGFGHNIAEGVALGINNQAPSAIKASDDMAKRLAQTEYSNKVLGAQSLTGSMSTGSIQFSPTINVNVGTDDGNVAAQVQQGLSISYREFERMLEQVEANRTRRAFA